MNLRKSILALSVVAGIVAAPMTVFAAHTHSWGSPQYYGYEDEMMLSRLVDTFFSRTSWTMLLYAENHSISVA